MADETPIDDSNLMETFYRFDSQSGNDIVNSQQNMYQCGTECPMYMIGKWLPWARKVYMNMNIPKG